MTRVPTRQARAFSVRLTGFLKDLPSFQHDRPGYQVGIDRIKAAIADEGGTCREQWYAARVSIHGFGATSTQGIAQACHNWIAQVTAKAEAAALEGIGQ